jgi:hypothetical protein
VGIHACVSHTHCNDLRVLSNELDALGDVALELADGNVDELLLVLGDLADLVDLLNTVGAELNVGGEEVDALILEERGLDEGRLDHTLLALSGLEEGLGEAGTSHGHGESGRASTVLGLDDLVTTELDALDVGGKVLALEVVAALAEQRDDGLAGVATNDNDVLVGRVGALVLGDEARGANDIKSGDTEETLGVVDTGLLQDLSGDRNGAVDGVGDNEDVGLGGVLGDRLGEVADDGGVGVEQVFSSLALCPALFHRSCDFTYHHGSCQACGEHRRGSGRSRHPQGQP